VGQGEKWSATKWIHTGSFGQSSEEQRAKWGECIDADDRCGFGKLTTPLY